MEGHGPLVRLAIRVDREHGELVLAELLDLAPSGVEEVDVSDQLIEYAVYGAPGELPSLPDLEALAGDALVHVSTSEVAADWAERWRAFHRPLVLGDRLTVRPPWEPAGQTELDVVIDPGQAFGTGAHATTRLCLELLLGFGGRRRVLRRSRLRVGRAGDRGVVARLAPVVALDFDPLAVQATAANAAVNGVTVDVRRFDLLAEQAPDADLVVANVLAGPLLSWAGLQKRLPARLILSGLLTGETDRVAAAYAARGMTLVETRVHGDWAALVLTR